MAPPSPFDWTPVGEEFRSVSDQYQIHACEHCHDQKEEEAESVPLVDCVRRRHGEVRRLLHAQVVSEAFQNFQ